MRGLTYIFVAALAAACASTKPVVVQQPRDAGNAQDDGSNDGPCSAACMNLRELQCPAGFVTRGGVSCESICLDARSSGYLPWPAECAVGAQTKEAVRSCGFACP